jgi:hypothetical protein
MTSARAARRTVGDGCTSAAAVTVPSAPQMGSPTAVHCTGRSCIQPAVNECTADILSQRFFAQTPPTVETSFPDDPPSRPTRTLPHIDEEFVGSLLHKAASKSAPGQLGHTWTILKWAWAADANRFLGLITACLKAGHHPRLWKEAVVCVIPKPKRADYTLAKNFRPISLLECLGKLLEKVVAKTIYKEMETHALVPSNQFGGRNTSSTLHQQKC